MKSRKARYVVVGAATLVLATVILAFLPPVRSWLLDESSGAALKLVPLSDIGPDGEPLAGDLLIPVDDGYPTGDGRALFWLEDAGMPDDKREWLLLRLPDLRVMARARGFSRVGWLPGGKALGIVAREPAFGRLPVLYRFVDPWNCSYWTLDWRSGGVTRITLTDLPKSDKPNISTARFVTANGVQRHTFGDQDVSMPFVPEAHKVARGLLKSWRTWGGSTRTVVLTTDTRGAKGAKSTTVCSIDNPSLLPGAIRICATGDDTAILVDDADPEWVKPDDCCFYKLTVSTGQLEQIGLESTGTTDAHP